MCDNFILIKLIQVYFGLKHDTKIGDWFVDNCIDAKK